MQVRFHFSRIASINNSQRATVDEYYSNGDFWARGTSSKYTFRIHRYPFTGSYIYLDIPKLKSAEASLRDRPSPLMDNVEPYRSSLDFTVPGLSPTEEATRRANLLYQGAYYQELCEMLGYKVCGTYNYYGIEIVNPSGDAVADANRQAVLDRATRIAFKTRPPYLIRDLYSEAANVASDAANLQAKVAACIKRAKEMEVEPALVVRPTREGDLSSGPVYSAGEAAIFQAVINQYPEVQTVFGWVDGGTSTLSWSGFWPWIESFRNYGGYVSK